MALQASCHSMSSSGDASATCPRNLICHNYGAQRPDDQGLVWFATPLPIALELSPVTRGKAQHSPALRRLVPRHPSHHLPCQTFLLLNDYAPR